MVSLDSACDFIDFGVGGSGEEGSFGLVGLWRSSREGTAKIVNTMERCIRSLGQARRTIISNFATIPPAGIEIIIFKRLALPHDHPSHNDAISSAGN